MNSIKDIEEAGVNEDALEKRFEYYMAGEDQGVVATEQVPTQGLQPSLLDPKLWMVKTKPGKEREAVIHIMNRFFLKRELGESLNIFSVVAPDHCKGELVFFGGCMVGFLKLHNFSPTRLYLC